MDWCILKVQFLPLSSSVIIENLQGPFWYKKTSEVSKTSEVYSSFIFKRMLQKLLFSLGLIVIALGLTHCNRIKTPVPAYTETIYPLETGQSRIYLVIDTTFTTQDTIVDKFYMKEVIGEKETDLLGREVFRLETFRSDFDRGTDYLFVADRVGTVYKDGEFAERMEENQRFQILKFPVYPGIKWNGNLYNGLGEQDYKYQSIDTVIEVNGVTYDPAVFVLESLPSDTSSFIKYRLAYQLYAPELGKVMKYDLTKVRDLANNRFNPDKSYTRIEMLVE